MQRTSFKTWRKLWLNSTFVIRNLINKQKEVFSEMKLRERRTFILHILYSIFDGVCLGILALNEFVFLKDIGAGSLQVGILFQVQSFVMPFSIFLTYFMSRVKEKKKFLIRIALYTRLPLLLFIFFPDNVHASPFKGVIITLYLLIFLAYYLANPIILPDLNLFTKAIYRPNRFGRLFSYSLILNQLVLFFTTIFFGKLLDWQTNSYKYVFVFFGLIGFLSIYIITQIPYKEPKIKQIPRGKQFWKTVGRIFRDAVFILTKEKAFFDFERAMMVYGIGFMMALTVVTIYLSQQFHLSFTEVALYKNITILISILSFPIFGRVMDDGGDPRKFAVVSFTFAALFYALLAVAGIVDNQIFIGDYRIIIFLLIAFLLQGLFSGSMALIWGIGATYFAPREEAARFHAVHLSLTGIRGIIGPLLGVLIKYLFGFYGAFACIVGMEIIAIYLMRKSVKTVLRPSINI